MSQRILVIVAVLALAASACNNGDFGETVLGSDEAAVSAAADPTPETSAEDDVAQAADDAEPALEPVDETDQAETEAAPEVVDCGEREFLAVGFDPVPTDNRWCAGDSAFALLDVLGGNSIGYLVDRGRWTPVRMSQVPDVLDIGHLIDAGVALVDAPAICAQLIDADRVAAEQCEVLPNPGAVAITAVHLALQGDDPAAYVTPEGLDEFVSLVPETEGGTASFNGQVSYAAGLSQDGCWLAGDVSLECAVDLRDGEGIVISTIGVGVSPQGVTGPDFEGFTGEWLVAGVSSLVEPAPTPTTLSIYGAAGFEGEPTLRDVLTRFGGEADVTVDSPVQGSCFRAAGRGFPGLQFLVEGADSGDPLDGTVRAYWATSPDYATPSSMRVGTQRSVVTTELGLQLERVDGSGLAGYWLDFRAEDPAEQEITVRFWIGTNDVVMAVGSGARDWLASPDCGHLEPIG